MFQKTQQCTHVAAKSPADASPAVLDASRRRTETVKYFFECSRWHRAPGNDSCGYLQGTLRSRDMIRAVVHPSSLTCAPATVDPGIPLASQDVGSVWDQDTTFQVESHRSSTLGVFVLDGIHDGTSVSCMAVGERGRASSSESHRMKRFSTCIRCAGSCVRCRQWMSIAFRSLLV